MKISAFYTFVYAHTRYICVPAMGTFFRPPWLFLRGFPSKKFFMPTTNATSRNLLNSQLSSWERRNSLEGQKRALGTKGVKRSVNKATQEGNSISERRAWFILINTLNLQFRMVRLNPPFLNCKGNCSFGRLKGCFGIVSFNISSDK